MSARKCGLCGNDPAAGFASINDTFYCHGDEDDSPTCYERATIGSDAEIARLREFGEHYSGAAQDAWDRIAVLEKALTRVKENAESWHGNGEDGPRRALVVIARWCDEALGEK